MLAVPVVACQQKTRAVRMVRRVCRGSACGHVFFDVRTSVRVCVCVSE
jgi:hypothetical protein